jgi:hypothetical protein
MTAAASLPRLCFVHIPKTAGTSVTQALRAIYGEATLPAMTTLDYRRYDNTSLQQYRFYKGHAYRRDYLRLPEDTGFFTIIRDPVDRAISLYRYYRGLEADKIGDHFMREAVQLARRGSVMEFIYSDSPFIVEHIRLGQIRQFLPDELLAEIGHRQFLSRGLRDAAIAAFSQEMTRFALVLTHGMLGLSFAAARRALGLGGHGGRLGLENISAMPVEADRGDVRRALVDVNGAEFTCYDMIAARERGWLEAVQALPPCISE